MGLELRLAVAACFNFEPEEGGLEVKKTIIIAPTKVVDEGNITRIAWSCNMGHVCHSQYCAYATRPIASDVKTPGGKRQDQPSLQG